MEDPLPAGSTLRFGTSRFRYGSRVKTLAVSPDGKTAFVANDGDLPVASSTSPPAVGFFP